MRLTWHKGPSANELRDERAALRHSARRADTTRSEAIAPIGNETIARRCSMIEAHLGRLDVAAIAFQLHFGDAVKRHAHLLEPGRDSVLAGRFHHADRLTFGQVGEAAVALDVGILLR